MKQFLEKHFINVAIVAVICLVLVGAILSFYNRHEMDTALENLELRNRVVKEADKLYQNLERMDISSRGYALIPEDRFLFIDVESAAALHKRNFTVLDSLLALQNYKDQKNYTKVKNGFAHANKLYAQSVNLLKEGNQEEYLKILSADYGYELYPIYLEWYNELMDFENNLAADSNGRYESALQRNMMVQILLVVFGLPTLGLVLFNLKKQKKNRELLLENLKENNEKYLFNDGSKEKKEEVEILENSIVNLQRASEFVNQISEGNYNVQWENINEENAALNKDNLAGRLILMREQMKKVKIEDTKRLWATEGLSQFSEIIRNHQHDLEELCENALKFVAKYLNAQQGSLFILEGNEQDEQYLRLASCFAFDRKKFVEKRIEIGQGLVGQTYLEAKTLVLTQVPQAYTYITSGLGDATPSFLVIVPMMYNEKVQALIEIAAFEKFEAHQISFLEKAGEFVASAISTAQNGSKTKILFEQMQAQTEQMRAQEEELRQNMEELEATQEEMRRKEVALEEQLAGLKSRV